MKLLLQHRRFLFKFCCNRPSLTFISFATFLSSLRVSNLGMFSWGRKELQISNAVIRNIAVYVVNNLFSIQEPAKVFLHNKAVFSNISLLTTCGVPPTLNKNIAASFYGSSIHKLCSPLCLYFFNSVFTMPRRVKTRARTITCFLNRWFSKVSLSALFTNIFNHNGIIPQMQ